MDNIAWGVVLVLLTGVLWVTGALLQWSNIRRQERLVARLRRLSPRRKVKAPAPAEAAIPAEPVVECLRPANRWTVG